MPELIIRTAQPADREAILRTTIAAYEQYAPVMGPVWDVYRQSIIEALADIGDAVQFVAERDQALVGTVLLFPAGSHQELAGSAPEVRAAPEIRLLAVAPAARGLGAGKALVNACIHHTRDAGGRLITLHTVEIMQVAMQMYEKMGFVHDPSMDFHPVPQITVKGYRLVIA